VTGARPPLSEEKVGDGEGEGAVVDLAPLGWHVISGEQLLVMLRRVRDGEDPDMVYAEEYVNADREDA
jgi:hypothetical protein